jgi:hypothetical protein
MKTKVQIKSIFEQISEQVFTMTNLNEVKTYVVDFVSSKNINEIDKRNIIDQVQNTTSLTRFQTYICNSLLKYEGMGVGPKKEL